MNWRIKGLLQKALDIVPGGVAVNDLLQRQFGSMAGFDSHADVKIAEDWAVFGDEMNRLGIGFDGISIFEVGTGWMPAIPLCFHLAGAARCVTVDLNRHLNADLTFRLLARLEHHLPTIVRFSGLTMDAVRGRYDRLRRCSSIDALLNQAGIVYHAPGDAADSKQPDRSFDLVVSNSVFEHIPGPIIQRILNESHRILKEGGHSIHSVNCGDHYAYFDSSISPINYLSFTEDQWRFWNNSLLYQNRMRPADFLDMASRAGLELVLTHYKPNPKAVDKLPQMTIAPEFRRYPQNDLCATSVDFVGRRPVTRGAAVNAR